MAVARLRSPQVVRRFGPSTGSGSRAESRDKAHRRRRSPQVGRPSSPQVVVRSRLRQGRIRTGPLKALAQRILVAAGAPRAQLSVDVVGDGRMRRLNRLYRRIDRPTDVLAFAMREAGGPKSPLLGDVVISLPTAARQSAKAGHSINREMAILLVHGVLHLLGYDHEQGPLEARRMRRKEQALLRSLMPLPKTVKY